MQGIYTLTKPNTTKDVVVVDIIITNPECSEKFGWECQLDRNYSAHLKKVFPRDEFEKFADEVDQELRKAKLKSGGFLTNCLCVLTCCICGLCVKQKVDLALERALGGVSALTRKWNDKFIETDRPITMKVCTINRKLHRKDFRADGTMGALVDNANRLSQIDYESWIEIHVGSE
jgi:hypothetical protein